MNAFFFFFFDIDKLPEVMTIKEIIKQIALLGDRSGAPLSDTDKKLSDKMINLSVAMFGYNKLSDKHLTIKGDRRLKNMSISEDADGFKDDDILYLTEFFQNDPEAFSELVSISYLPKPPKKQRNNQRIFYASIYSGYSGKEHDVFFANISGEFFVFQNTTTAMRLTAYISDYFGKMDVENEERLTALSKDLQLPFLQTQRELTELIEQFNQKTKSKYDFVCGAITFLDFLAWKGLWQSEKGSKALEEVSTLIDTFRTKLEMYSEELFSHAQGIQLSRLISISDTIAIFTPKVSDIKEENLLLLHAKLSKYVLEVTVKQKYPIRGAITYGEYSIKNNIMIGPGIDECASWHEKGDWIGVHFTPRAQFIWYTIYGKAETEYVYCVSNKDKLPLKSGIPAIDYCIKWNVNKAEFHDLAMNNKALLPEISGKYMNTFRYLESTAWKEGDNDGKK